MYKNGLLKKTVAIGIFVLFIGMIIVPGITSEAVKKEETNNESRDGYNIR